MKTIKTFPAVVLLLGVMLTSGCVATGGTAQESKDAARVNTELAAAYLGRGDVNLAMEKVERALDQNEEYAEAYLVKGMILARAEEFDKADDYYMKAVRYGRDNPAVLGNVAAYLCNRQEYREGEKVFLDIARMPTYSRPAVALTNAGVCAKRIPALDRAEQHLRRALDFEPNYPQALSIMAELSFDQGEWLRARAFLQRLEGVQPLGPDGLLLGARIERKLGDGAAERRYADILRRDFAGSKQARLLGEQTN